MPGADLTAGASNLAPGATTPASYAIITSWARSRAWSLVSSRLTWVLAVAWDMNRVVGDLRVGQAVSHGREHLGLPWGQLGEGERRRSWSRAVGMAHELLDESPGHAGREQRFTAGDHAHGGEQVGGQRVLEQEPAGAGPQGVEHVLVEVERGEDHDPGGGQPIVTGDPPRRLDPVHLRHPDVHQDDVGPFSHRQLERGAARRRLRRRPRCPRRIAAGRRNLHARGLGRRRSRHGSRRADALPVAAGTRAPDRRREAGTTRAARRSRGPESVRAGAARVGRQRRCRRRHDHLTAMTARGDPRRLVHGQTRCSHRCGRHRLTSVHAHPNANGRIRRPVLDGETLLRSRSMRPAQRRRRRRRRSTRRPPCSPRHRPTAATRHAGSRGGARWSPRTRASPRRALSADDPSMSVKQNVTSPLGNSATEPASRRRRSHYHGRSGRPHRIGPLADDASGWRGSRSRP